MPSEDARLPDIAELPRERDWRLLLPSAPDGPPWGKWNHQYRAYEFAERYLGLAEPDKYRRAALIRMPTGSGKTGIMALIANYFLKGKSLLIVVPSTFLTGQVSDVLRAGFWHKLGKQPPAGPTRVEAFLPSTLARVLDQDEGPIVLVCTTKALTDVRTQGDRALFVRLRRRVSAVLVDEGHREPAPAWAVAIRDLGHPTLLFSATPYRNDLRMFRIGRGKDYRFAVRYQEMTEASVIRSVEFRAPARPFVTKVPRGPGVRRDVRRFVEGLLAFYHGALQREKPRRVQVPRVVIRCDNPETIRNVQFELLRAERARAPGADPAERVVAVHEEFDNKNQRFDQVPRQGSDVASKAIFWIHQFKMTEGLDDPDLCVVAFFEPFANSRSLVQQIGRVLRNPGQAKGAKAFVFSDAHDGLEKEWNGYLEFEKSEQDVIGAEDIVSAIQEAQPRWFYADGKYREGADFKRDGTWEDLRIPATARIYNRPDPFDLEDFRRVVRSMSAYLEADELVEIEILEREHPSGGCTAVIVHWEIAQSENIEEAGFFNVRLALTVFHLGPRFLCYQGRLGLEILDAPDNFQLVDIDRLEALIPPGPATLKQLSLVNCDLGDTAIRRRALGGRALEASAAALNDHLHFISSVACRDGAHPRYVGLRQSRVTDRVGGLLTLDEFREWVSDLSEQIAAPRPRKHPLLRRYATPMRSPQEASARHLLLDLADFREQFDLREGGDVPEFAEEFLATACAVDEDGGFSCVIGDITIDGTISYKDGRFRLKSEDLNDSFVAKDNKKKMASSYLSHPSFMSVVTEDGLLYSDGRFFRPTRLHGPDRVSDHDIVVTVPGLEQITPGLKEKGERGKIGRGTWQAGSLFSQIDRNQALFTNCEAEPDILVCDDLATEVGDFVAVDQKRKKIIVIHGKVFDGEGSLSAKAMHEVVAQAKKNLGFLDPAEVSPRNRGRKWDGNWKTGDAELRRIRLAPAGCTGDDIIGIIRGLLQSTSVQKEVWLVLGNAFTAEQLERVMKQDEIDEWHWIQLLYLIHSCQASVNALGARLRILTGAQKEKAPKVAS